MTKIIIIGYNLVFDWFRPPSDKDKNARRQVCDVNNKVIKHPK